MNSFDFKEKLNSNIINIDDFFVRVERDNYQQSSPQHIFQYPSDETKQKLNKATYLVKFFPKKDVFIVWDIQRHREISSAGGYTFKLGKDWDSTITGPDIFRAYYKELGRHNSGIWEKIYVVGLSNFEKFFQDCDAYMKLNALDDGFPHNSSMAIKEEKTVNWRTESERKKYSSLQHHRDKLFRDTILNAYGSKCAICRCPINELLQAAHERGYEVSNTKYDDPKHGICLCANHHLLYDHELIDIDLKMLMIFIKDERIKLMPWYREFVSKYKGKILGRNDHA